MTDTPLEIRNDTVVVSHFHWDREWYRTMQGFRARLVDAIDQVLDLAGTEDGYRFLLDGQTVVLEDYLVVRPDRRGELVDHIRAGRLAIGPWFVQPDSLLPSGEAHIRNLLEGRAAEATFGPVSQVAYVPDSFGHPAQFPQIFAGFGFTGFVHWRGNGNELDVLGPRWLWMGPDDTSIPVHHLTQGYFAASRPPPERAEAITALGKIIRRLHRAGEDPAIVMNGFDHTRPDPELGELLTEVATELDTPIRRGTLDDAVKAGSNQGLPEFSGELVGGRIANLLPGVWSTRMPLKIRNREIEHLLQNWVEPWVALGRQLGLPDETPSTREAWRSLLLNQAHDSICGCSIDAVHDRMAARYDDAEGLATETLERVLQRLAGRPADRDVPDLDDLDVVVFNAAPYPTTSVVRIPLDPHPAFAMQLGVPVLHSVVSATTRDLGFRVDGVPARVIESLDHARVRWFPGQSAIDIEFVAADIPAFGCRRFRLVQSERVEDVVDDGREIATPDTRVIADADGTVTLETQRGRWRKLFAVEDVGDRGDSYDVDPVGEPLNPRPERVEVERHRHGSGIERLIVRRYYQLPTGLTDDRTTRQESTREVESTLEITLAPGVPGTHVRTILHNTVNDHRLRLAFPTGAPATEFLAETTLDTVTRATAPPNDNGWVRPAPTTFCNQGAVAANDLIVVAKGLPEAEVRADGTILLTLVRSVGWLARYDLASRPMPAGPEMQAPGAQCIGPVTADIRLLDSASPPGTMSNASDLRAVVGGPEPLLEDDRALVAIDDEHITVSALKVAADGDGVVLRLLNPTGQDRPVTITLGLDTGPARSVRLDETDDDEALTQAGSHVSLVVRPHQLRSIRFAASNGTAADESDVIGQ